MLKFKKYDYDLIVIGSGAGGSVGAHTAKDLGKRVAIFEKGLIGGECPNIGCVPTKAILTSAKIFELAKNSAQYGIDIKGLDLNYPKVKKWKDLAVERTGATHGEEYFKKEGIDLIRAHANFIDPHTIEADGKKYSAAHFLLATGSSVFIPPINGLKESGYITFEEAINFNKLPQSIFILGGGPIGCEFAQILNTFGSRVILADVLPKLLAREDSSVSEIVQALFEQRGVEVLTNINVTEVSKVGNHKKVTYTKDDKTHSLIVEEILVATGKRAVLSFDPEKAGIKLDNGHLKVNKFLQTNVSHIYAAGDLAGPYQFTHTGYYQSYIATHNAFSYKKISADYSVVPRCVFSDPEVATVGLSLDQAKEQGIKTKVGLCATGVLGRANTSNEFDGFIKVITDKNEVIIGAALVCPHAGELIHLLALAVKLRVKASVLADMMYAYPTFSEGIKVACSSLE